MITKRPPDYREVVHPRRRETRVFILAATEPCIKMRDDASKPSGRDYQAVAVTDFIDVAAPPRWLLAVILCPGDGTTGVVQWLAVNSGDPERVVFFLHPRTDPIGALRAWYDAGFSDPVVYEASTWKELARPLGRFVNDWIYLDATGAGWPL